MKIMKKKSFIFVLSFLLLSSSVLATTNIGYSNNIVVKAADSDAKPIAIDASQTKIQGAGAFVFLTDKPNITIDDFEITFVDFISTQFANYRDNLLATGAKKVRYNQDTGELYFEFANGFPDDSGTTMIFNITYELDGVTYSQNVEFLANAYQEPNATPKAPTNLKLNKITGNNQAVTIDFTESSNATGYKLYITDSSNNPVTGYDGLGITNGYTLDISSFAEGTYDVCISAYNDNGESEKTSEKTLNVNASGEIDEEATVTLPIAIDASQTKIQGAGAFVFLTDKPNITIDDFEITFVDFISTQFANYRDNLLATGAKKVRYNQDTGELYFEFANGFPDDSGTTMIFNITYELDGVTYSQNVEFLANAYQEPNATPKAPTNLKLNKITGNNQAVTIDFTESSNATGYKLYITDSSNNPVTGYDGLGITNGYTLDISSFAEGTYDVCISAYNDNGESDKTSEKTLNVNASGEIEDEEIVASKLPTPIGLVANVSADNLFVTIAWNGTSTNKAKEVRLYVYEEDDVTEVTKAYDIVVTNGKALSLSEYFEEGHTYRVYIASIGDGTTTLDSDRSAAASFTYPVSSKEPSAPTGLVINEIADTKKAVIIAFGASTNADGYKLYITDSSDNPVTGYDGLIIPNGYRLDISSFTTGDYGVYVTAYNTVGESAKSTKATLTVNEVDFFVEDWAAMRAANEGSICGYLNGEKDSATLDALLERYEAFSNDEKAIIDAQEDGDCTIGTTIAYINSYLAMNTSNLHATNSNLLNETIKSNLPLVFVIASLSVVAMIGYYYLNKKKLSK